MDAAKPAPASRMLDALLAVAVLALAFLLGSFAAGGVGNSDLWYHLASGRLLAANDYPFGADPFSAHDPAPPWVNHAWLFDLLLYSVYRGFGGAAVVALKAAIVALTAFVLLRTRRPGSDGLWPAIAVVLALLAISPRLALQPAVVSYLMFAVLQFGLTRPPGAARWRLPLFAGVLFALWVNLDGGFWLGLILIAVRLVGAVLDRVVPLGDAEPGDAPSDAGRLAATLAAALLGCLVNPYLHNALLAVPTDFVYLRVPADLRGDWLFRNFFLMPFSADYTRAAGLVSVCAYGILLGGGVLAFFLNAAGWRWGRVLSWFAFAGLSLFYARLVPYAAVVAAPALAVSVQAAWGRWLAARRDKLTAEGKHVLAFAGSFGRFVPLLAIGVLVFLAWPGWLAGDPGGVRGLRRVAWAVEPEPTHERLAKQLAAWYADGRLRPGEVRGFNVNPEFAYYCAWFCPQQKALFDLRLTSPPAVWADYAAARKGMINFVTSGGGEPGDVPPEPILAKHRVTFVAASGDLLLQRGLARVFLARPERWPLWAIAGQGAIVGFRESGSADAYGHLRADPVALAMNPPEKLPAPADDRPPPALPGFWDTYLSPAPAIPPETHESALWLVVYETSQGRFLPTTLLWSTAGAVVQSAPTGSGDLTRPVEQLSVAWLLTQTNAIANTYELWRWFTPDGRQSRAAVLLSLRAARRAVAASPYDYEGYLRLMRAYMALDSDATFTTPQKLTAARQALARLPLAEANGQDTTPDAYAIHEVLLETYQKTPIVPGAQVPAVDLISESLQARLALVQASAARRGESVPKQMVEQADQVKEQLKKRSDDFENAAGTAKPAQRAMTALSRGLAREAVKALNDQDAKELDPRTVELLGGVLLLIGEGEQALELAKALAPRGSPGAIDLRVKAAAALGDYDTAMAALEEPLELGRETLGRPLGWLLQSLHFPDVTGDPLTRALTCPSWGGTKIDAERYYTGDLMAVTLGIQHRYNLQAQVGILALEQGDMPKAKERLGDAVRPKAGMPLHFDWRAEAARWLQLFDPKAAAR